MPTVDEIMDMLRTVRDPELHRDLVSLNMVKDVAVDGATVRVHVELTTPACPQKEVITRDVKAAVGGLDGVKSVELEFSADVRGARERASGLPGVRNVIAVGAGKGGVGKSTVSVMLAVGLARSGASVGLLDADIYGPSVPKMMGTEGIQPRMASEKQMLPIESCGIRTMSIGSIISADQAVVWRGPMIHGVITQFLQQVDWGELDYLIIDLPPGTGDVPLTLAQSIPMAGAVVVCTPQDVAISDVRRAVKMYQQLNVSCLGLVENMSYYLCPSCGHRDEIFDHGGAEVAARELGVPFLGAIPLNAALRAQGDAGTPEKCFTDAPNPVREAIEAVVQAVAGQVSVLNMSETEQPTLSIE